MKLIRRFFSSVPKYLLWIVLSTLFWLWIFTIITDTSAEKKIVLYADAAAVADPGLSVELEKSMPEGIKMIRARSFSYLMFNEAASVDADIYIIREDDIEENIENFAPMDAAWAVGKSGVYYENGTAFGIRVYDAETGSGAAQDFIAYSVYDVPALRERTGIPPVNGDVEALPPCDYYLFFGANSLHCGKLDMAAYDIADAFLALP